MLLRTVFRAAVVASMFAARAAEAQEPPAPPPPAPPPPTQPAPSAVRVYFHTPEDATKARLYMLQGDKYDFVCNAPCTVDITRGAKLRTVVNENEAETTDFVLSDEARSLDVEAKRGGTGMRTAGVACVAAGTGLGFLGGLILAMTYSDGNIGEETDRTPALVMVGVAAAVAATGIVLMVARSKEPSVRQEPKERVRTEAWRRPIVTPVSLTFEF